MARYLVTLLPGAFDKAGAALGHLADEEEGAVRAARLESVKKPGGVAARGAVVEGERNELISGKAPTNISAARNAAASFLNFFIF